MPVLRFVPGYSAAAASAQIRDELETLLSLHPAGRAKGWRDISGFSYR
jgi:hypothetical protein